MLFLSPCGCPERPSPPPGFQELRPSRAGRTCGFAQWAERRRPAMEPAALRYVAPAGCARRRCPRGGSAGRISAPSAPVSPLRLAMRCPGKTRDSRGSRGALLPCLGVAFRPFCSPGRRIGFCFLSRELGGGRFRPPRPGNSRRCHGTRHLLRGAASRGTRPGVRSIPSCVARRGDLAVSSPPGLPLVPLNRGPKS